MIISGKISKLLGQNSKLIIHPNPDRNQSKLTVCSGSIVIPIEYISMRKRKGFSRPSSMSTEHYTIAGP